MLLASLAILPGRSHTRTAQHPALQSGPSPAVALVENPQAARLCNLAWFYRNKATAADLVKAIALFRLATKTDPLDPRAWAGLADSLATRLETAELDTDRDATMDESELASQRALTLGPSIPEAHMAAGTVDWQAGKIQQAENEYKRALALNPQYGEAQYSFATLLSETGRLSEAKAQFDRSMQLEPSSVRVLANAAVVYARLGLYDQALQFLYRAVDMNDESVLAYGNLGQVLTFMHRYREAAAAFHKAGAEAGTLLPYAAAEAYCLGRMGRTREARAILLKVLRQPHQEGDFQAWAAAVIYAGLSENKASEQALRQAIADGETTPQKAAMDPYFTSPHGPVP